MPESRYVGEVGLDAGPAHYRTIDLQREVFRTVLEASAAAGGKVLSVHSVRSARAVLDMVEEHLPRDRGTVVLHWFTGTASEAARAAGLGCYFSVNARMLLDEKGRKFVRSLPASRLLTETDGPFTEEAGRPSRPSDVASAVRALAACVGTDEHRLNELLRSNLQALTAT